WCAGRTCVRSFAFAATRGRPPAVRRHRGGGVVHSQRSASRSGRGRGRGARMRLLRWEGPTEQRPLPKHPYRDTALVYGGMAAFIVLVAVLTGGDVGRAVMIALLVFLAAT